MNKLFNFFRKTLKRADVIITILLLALIALLVWFIVTGFSQSVIIVSIGIAAISALFAAFSSFANLLQAFETRKQRENQERPYVTAHFDGGTNGIIYFIIRNYGTSPALRVRINFDPIPIDRQNRPLNQVSLFAHPISFLPPDKTLRQLIDVGYRFLAEDRPKKFVIRTTYESIFQERFTEEFEDDLSYLVQANVPAKSVEEVLSDIDNQLKELIKTIKSTTKLGSVMVETPEMQNSRLQKESGTRNP